LNRCSTALIVATLLTTVAAAAALPPPLLPCARRLSPANASGEGAGGMGSMGDGGTALLLGAGARSPPISPDLAPISPSPPLA
jgi:hypothetical protein